MERAEHTLANSRETVSVLQAKLEATETQVALLKHERYLLMQKFEEQTSTRDTLVASLHSQLEDKSNTIAQLVHKIHQMQRMVQRGGAGLQKGGAGVLHLQESLLPLPPKEVPPDNIHRINRITRRGRKLSDTPTTISAGNNSLLDYSPPTHIRPINPPSSSSRLSKSYEGRSLVNHGRNSRDFEPSLREGPLDLPPGEGSPRTRRVDTPSLRLPPIPLPPGPRPRHRRFQLAQSQGLTSAPSSFRTSNYESGSVTNRESNGEGRLLESQNDEGKLLVKHESDNRTFFNRIHQQFK